MTAARAAARALGATQLALGVALTVSPGHVLLAVDADDDAVSRTVARVLGARLVGQGTVLIGSPRVRVLHGSAVIDTAHATTMVALAVHSPTRRPAAVASGALATVAALTSMLIARRIGRTS